MLWERSRPRSKHRGLERGGQVSCVSGEPWVVKERRQAGCCHVNPW